MSAAGRTFVDIIVYYTNILWFSDIILNNRSLVSTRRGHAIYFPCFFRLFFLLCTLDEHFRTVHFCHFLLLLTKSALIFARQGFFCPPFLSIPHKPPAMYTNATHDRFSFSVCRTVRTIPVGAIHESPGGSGCHSACSRLWRRSRRIPIFPSLAAQRNESFDSLHLLRMTSETACGRFVNRPYAVAEHGHQLQWIHLRGVYYIIYNVCACYTAALPWGLPVTGLDLHFRPLHCTNHIDGLSPGYSIAMRR